LFRSFLNNQGNSSNSSSSSGGGDTVTESNPNPRSRLSNAKSEVAHRELLKFIEGQLLPSMLMPVESAVFTVASSHTLDAKEQEAVRSGDTDSASAKRTRSVEGLEDPLSYAESTNANYVDTIAADIAETILAPSRGVVAFFCFEFGNSWWPKWGPSSARPGGRGLGGSEESVMYMAQELAKLG
jgi:hypothetical protein